MIRTLCTTLFLLFLISSRAHAGIASCTVPLVR